MKLLANRTFHILSLLIVTGSFLGAMIAAPASAYAAQKTPKYFCGGNHGTYSKKISVGTSINIGCQGKGNPVMDMLFAFIRFLSYGAGLVIIGSLIWAGIQYTTSRGDPQATAASKDRIVSVLIALLIFIFASAILDFILPGQVLK